MIDRPSFIAIFPEFGDLNKYPQAQFDFWTAEAGRELNANRLGDSLPVAQMLFVAHNLTLSAQAARSAASGSGSGVGQVSGPISSKSVGSVSKSIDTSATAVAGANDYNATSYGRRLYAMLKRFSLGPVVAVPYPQVPGPYGARVASPYLGFGFPY